jgi:hypothetical protein
MEATPIYDALIRELGKPDAPRAKVTPADIRAMQERARAKKEKVSDRA